MQVHFYILILNFSSFYEVKRYEYSRVDSQNCLWLPFLFILVTYLNCKFIQTEAFWFLKDHCVGFKGIYWQTCNIFINIATSSNSVFKPFYTQQKEATQWTKIKVASGSKQVSYLTKLSKVTSTSLLLYKED